jgi:hypothetical protein
MPGEGKSWLAPEDTSGYFTPYSSLREMRTDRLISAKKKAFCTCFLHVAHRPCSPEENPKQ